MLNIVCDESQIYYTNFTFDYLKVSAEQTPLKKADT